MGARAVTTLEIEDIRNARISQQRDWYLSDDGFLDFVRDSERGVCR